MVPHTTLSRCCRCLAPQQYALTIDDGPTSVTPAMLDKLAARGVEASALQKSLVETSHSWFPPSPLPHVLCLPIDLCGGTAPSPSQVSFFLLGKSIKGFKGTPALELSSGHSLHSHSYDHPSLPTLTAAEVRPNTHPHTLCQALLAPCLFRVLGSC